MTQVSRSGPIAVLIGSPGAGKSTVGRRVARRLNVNFADSDALIEERVGKPISDIFVDDGEAAFRDWEESVIAEALESTTGILSLGGGAVLRPATRARLADHRVVWLKVGLSDAAARVGLNTARPLLLGNTRGTLGRLLDERTPVYEATATDVVDTSGRTMKEVVDAVVATVTAPGGAGRGEDHDG